MFKTTWARALKFDTSLRQRKDERAHK